MNPPDRPDGALAPWSPSPLATTPAAGWDDPAAQEPAPPRMFSPKIVLRAIRRHWWQILAIWAVGTAGLIYLATTRIKPMFEAVAWLTVEPAREGILNPHATSAADFGPYLDTQVLLITSPDVLAEALDKPEVKSLPRIRASDDPEIDLRKEIAVGIPTKGTHLIKVQMTGEDPSEAATIVNAVVAAYLAKASAWTDEAAAKQLANLKESEDHFAKVVDDLRKQVRSLSRKSQSVAGDDAKTNDAPRDADRAGRAQITMEEWRQLNSQLNTLRIERLKAETTVKALDDEVRARNLAAGAPARGGAISDQDLEERIKQEFYTLPDTPKLLAARQAAEDKFERARRRIKNHRDPTYVRAKEEMDQAVADYEDHWANARPSLIRRAREASFGGAPASDPTGAQRENDLLKARLDLQALKVHEKALEEQIVSAKIEVQNATNDMVDLEMAREELRRQEDLLATIMRSREQIDMDLRYGTRVREVAKAKVPRAPSSNNRMKAVLAAPVVTLALACLLFVAVEYRSGRVADPEELSQRARLGILGVVPPLPSPAPAGRALSARGLRDERRRVEEFVQSLDHLRVTLCAPRAGKSDRRCVLITSATGGEGKTTLAAQLAGRCANAGLMTLLIDADLRRPSLGDLLEVPEGPGLVDVLSDDVPPEAAMVVIGNAGGFHLLPAGTLGQDPSRLLHGDRVGRLIAQFRETFDIVIIDAPPVLAVPDALLLGRWTDGAVLAVRHDASRFPLVERANRRLASVGVPVLGAVVNGCRTMESTYGSYRYTPYAAAEAPGGGEEV